MGENKAFNIAIDKTYNSDQQMMKEAGHVMGEQVREQFVPTCDKHLIDKWTKGAGYTVELSVANGSVTGKNLITALLAIETHYNNKFVDINDRYVAVRFADLALLRDADRWANVEAQTDKFLVRGKFEEFGTLKVFGMPDTWFPAGARMIAFQSKAVLAPMKIKTTRIITDSERIDGAILQGHFYYDGFVVGRRCDGVVVVADKGLKSAAPVIDGTTITGNGTVYYTTDGSDPRYSATRKVYSGAIEGAENVKAVAYEEGKFVSDVAEK